MHYGTGDRIELIIRDGSGGKIDTFKCPVDGFYKIVPILRKKYGVIIFKSTGNKDLGWLQD